MGVSGHLAGSFVGRMSPEEALRALRRPFLSFGKLRTNQSETASPRGAFIRGKAQNAKIISQSFFNGFGQNLGLDRSPFIVEYDIVEKPAV